MGAQGCQLCGKLWHEYRPILNSSSWYFEIVFLDVLYLRFTSHKDPTNNYLVSAENLQKEQVRGLQIQTVSHMFEAKSMGQKER